MEVEVKIVIEINDTIGTEDEMNEYIEYELGYSGGIKINNPYNKEGMEIIDLEIM